MIKVPDLLEILLGSIILAGITTGLVDAALNLKNSVLWVGAGSFAFYLLIGTHMWVYQLGRTYEARRAEKRPPAETL